MYLDIYADLQINVGVGGGGWSEKKSEPVVVQFIML